MQPEEIFSPGVDCFTIESIGAVCEPEGILWVKVTWQLYCFSNFLEVGMVSYKH